MTAFGKYLRTPLEKRCGDAALQRLKKLMRRALKT